MQRKVTEHTALTMTAEKLEKKTTIGMEPQRRYGPAPASLWTKVAVRPPHLLSWSCRHQGRPDAAGSRLPRVLRM